MLELSKRSISVTLLRPESELSPHRFLATARHYRSNVIDQEMQLSATSLKISKRWARAIFHWKRTK